MLSKLRVDQALNRPQFLFSLLRVRKRSLTPTPSVGTTSILLIVASRLVCTVYYDTSLLLLLTKKQLRALSSYSSSINSFVFQTPTKNNANNKQNNIASADRELSREGELQSTDGAPVVGDRPRIPTPVFDRRKGRLSSFIRTTPTAVYWLLFGDIPGNQNQTIARSAGAITYTKIK